VIRDTHAPRAPFTVVVLKQHPTQCWITARIWKMPPFAPRFTRP
jgi:hypothetical protein